METMSLHMLKEKLEYSKVESVIIWCEKHNIKVFGSRSKRWVLALDIETELNKDLIAHLIEMYGNENWKQVYEYYRRDDIYSLIELKLSINKTSSPHAENEYTPQSEGSMHLLNKFK